MTVCLLDTMKLYPGTSIIWLPTQDLRNDNTSRHANLGGGILKGLEKLQEIYIFWERDNLLQGPPTDRLANPKRSVLNTYEQY